MKVRERPLTLTHTLWAGVRKGRLTCRVHICPFHNCRASSSGYCVLEQTLLFKNFRAYSLPERSFCCLLDLSLGDQLANVEGQTAYWRMCAWEGNMRLMMKQTCSCALPLAAATYLWRLGGLVESCLQSRYRSMLVQIQTKHSFRGCPLVLTSWLCQAPAVLAYNHNLLILFIAISILTASFPSTLKQMKAEFFPSSVHWFSMVTILTCCSCWSHSYTASSWHAKGRKLGCNWIPKLKKSLHSKHFSHISKQFK